MFSIMSCMFWTLCYGILAHNQFGVDCYGDTLSNLEIAIMDMDSECWR